MSDIMGDRESLSREQMESNREGTRAIFREDAIRRYIESREKAVLPRLVSPQIFSYLWVLLGLIAASSAIAWFAKIPIYASGTAIVTRWQNQSKDMGKEPIVVIFLPPQYLSRLRPQQRLFLKFAGMDDRISWTILSVDSKIHSPDSIQRKFDLSPSSAQAIAQPVIVAIARWEETPTQLLADVYLGSLGRAEVEIGSQRAISLLPMVGNLFTEEMPPKVNPI
jgi:hypothetical protein